MPKEEKENCFEIKVIGKSTIYKEWQIMDLIYELLENKAEFQIQ